MYIHAFTLIQQFFEDLISMHSIFQIGSLIAISDWTMHIYDTQ
ncbi:unnamed protein product [Paramecium sonneborni]|uniref:Uncharacterized protein n=1 Tax=Paramecium sonneborni TaxID=65129 RepID=A0A8S1RLB6_9CILI|nr:unnamed protein product [Paramecium sonneborni]